MRTLENGAHRIGLAWRRLLSRFGARVFRTTDSWMERESSIYGGPIFDPASFDWIGPLEARAKAIRAEAVGLLARRDALPSFAELSPAQSRIADDDRWKVFAFYGFGERSARDCALCPETAAALDAIPGVFNAFFSILAPGKHVPRHSGVTRGFIRCHLALVVPADRERCRMDVDGSSVVWEEGRAVVFDDSRPHEVWNDTDETRVVLLFDVARPMGLRGRALLALLMWLLRLSHYVREPIARQRAWEERTRGMFGPESSARESRSAKVR